MRVLITGAEGQDGFYLTKALRARGIETVGTALHQDALGNGSIASVTLDVTDRHATSALVAAVAPDVIVHLAAISNVPFANEHPEAARAVNVDGFENILRAVSAHSPETQIVNASSVEVFAPSLDIINEDSALGGVNVYAATKQAALQLARTSNLRIANVLLSNHESPLRTTAFVTGKIAAGVSAISRGTAQSLTLGDIEVQRDWSSARDIVAGMVAVIERGFTGDVILASGITRPLRELVVAAFASVGIVEWERYVEFDRALVRSEAPSRFLDVTKALRELDWTATTPVEQWMGEMVASFGDPSRA